MKLSRQQQKSMFKWFNLIETEAARQGVTFDMIIRHTHQLKITKEGLHLMCKDLIKPLFGYESTTEIERAGDMDIIIDHFTDLLSKEMEVPAFPSNEENPEHMNAKLDVGSREVPEQTEKTMADKF